MVDTSLSIQPFLIDLTTYKDNRGIFYESYKDYILNKYKGVGGVTEVLQDSPIYPNINFKIVQENTCISNKNVVRGLHYQTKPYLQNKLLQVLNGKIKDILVNINNNEIWEFTLNSKKPQLLYIPSNFAHGYISLEDNTIISYKIDNYYNNNYEKGINPLSSSLINLWGVKKKYITISNKDKNLPIMPI